MRVQKQNSGSQKGPENKIGLKNEENEGTKSKKKQQAGD